LDERLVDRVGRALFDRLVGWNGILDLPVGVIKCRPNTWRDIIDEVADEAAGMRGDDARKNQDGCCAFYRKSHEKLSRQITVTKN
jgi:hypothetical protein